MKHKLLVVPMILALAGAGCGGSGSTSTGPSGMAGSGAAPANSGNCTNPYYPFKVGSKIVYKTTYGTTNSNYTMEVQPADNADTHKLVYTFTVRGQSFPITQEFVCDRDGIRAKGMLDLASALGGANFSFETNSVDGPFMPADMSVGTKWETTYNVTLHTTNAAMARMMAYVPGAGPDMTDFLQPATGLRGVSRISGISGSGCSTSYRSRACTGSRTRRRRRRRP